MEKIIVHSIRITRPMEKHIFQIRLPENTEAITGLGVTCNKGFIWDDYNPKLERGAGTLQLFVADTGEHLFADDVKNTTEPPVYQKFDEVCFERKLWSYKKKSGLLDTWQPVHTTIIDGYYRDFIGYYTYSVQYKVHIYIRIKLS